jgi:hypothetical protein
MFIGCGEVAVLYSGGKRGAMVHWAAGGNSARTECTPSRARIFAMATAAAPGGVEGGIGTVATPFWKEAEAARGAERGVAEVRVLRIFPRRMDCSKSEGVRAAVVFFETRRESGARDSTRKAESSFSATCADRVGRDVGGGESADLGGSGLAGGGAGATRGDGSGVPVVRGWTAADFPGRRAGVSG